MDQHLEWVRRLIRQVTERDADGAANSIRGIGELERRLARQALGEQ